jgi:hypothetical protein
MKLVIDDQNSRLKLHVALLHDHPNPAELFPEGQARLSVAFSPSQVGLSTRGKRAGFCLII